MRRYFMDLDTSEGLVTLNILAKDESEALSKAKRIMGQKPYFVDSLSEYEEKGSENENSQS